MDGRARRSDRVGGGRRELYILHGNVKLMESCVKLRRGGGRGWSEGMVGRGGECVKSVKGRRRGRRTVGERGREGIGRLSDGIAESHCWNALSENYREVGRSHIL